MTISDAYMFMSDKMKAQKKKICNPLTDKIRELSKFNGIGPNGGTDSISGLLRSLLILVEGNDPNKIIVIISDGEDMDGPKSVADKFLDNSLCDRIKGYIVDKTTPIPITKQLIFIIYQLVRIKKMISG